MKQAPLEDGNLNLSELLDKIEELIEHGIIKYSTQKEPAKPKPLGLISRKEVASLLKISLPTLNDWTKSGLLKSYRIGTRILYKIEEVEKSLFQRDFSKYKRGGYNEA